jgi:hypothetical protein
MSTPTHRAPWLPVCPSPRRLLLAPLALGMALLAALPVRPAEADDNKTVGA